MFGKVLPTLAITALCLLQLVSAGPVAVERRQAKGPGTLKAPGIVYSAYKGQEGRSNCKTPDEVGKDIERLKDFGLIRLYGLDCDQVKNVLPHAKKHGIKLFVGIWEVDKLEAQVNQLADIVNNDWGSVFTVSIGNELILAKKKTGAEMNALTRDARTKLRAKGYNGPVVAVNVFYEVLQDGNLCNDQDYIAVNLHPFFDGKVKAENAGSFVKEMVRQVREKCKKDVLVTETGWPSQGNTNKAAVPSKDNQRKAIDNIKKEMNNQIILFTAFNDPWKPDNPSTFNAEKWWGIL